MMGSGRLGKLRVAGDVAYLLCAASLHHADRMADERRRCHCTDDEKKKANHERDWRKKRKRTNATLAVALVDAEHRNVSAEVTLAMGRLLADYYSDGVGFTLSICLCEGTVMSGSRKIKMGNTARTRKER